MTRDLSKPSAWRGVWTALVTPLNADLSLDRASLQKLLEAQIASGLRGLVIAGSTGEGSLLPDKTFEDLLTEARRICGDRVPLVSGLGIGDTAGAVRKAELARRLGYDGVLASPPAYVKAPQRGLKEHFLAVARVGLPVCLYEIPGRAVASIENATIVELLGSNDPAAKNFVALKDAGGDLTRPSELLPQVGARMALLSGDDPVFAGYLAQGGCGLISVASHVAPRALMKIQTEFEAGRVREAAELQGRLVAFIEALFWESNPIPVKSLLAATGAIASANFCLPLVPMKPELMPKLRKLAEGLT